MIAFSHKRAMQKPTFPRVAFLSGIPDAYQPKHVVPGGASSEQSLIHETSKNIIDGRDKSDDGAQRVSPCNRVNNCCSPGALRRRGARTCVGLVAKRGSQRKVAVFVGSLRAASRSRKVARALSALAPHSLRPESDAQAFSPLPGSQGTSIFAARGKGECMN